MSTTSIATIISIIASGVIAYLIARWQMKKNQIDHYFINSYDIGKGLTDDFPDFALHYGYEVLSNNVMVLQGGFMNTGRNDIGERDKKTEIKLVLPEGCAVKAVKVSPSVNGLKVCIEDSQRIEEKKRNDELCFEIDGVMKSKEWFNYIAIRSNNVITQISPHSTPLAITIPISFPKVRFIVHNAKNPAIVVRELPKTEVIV